jgi:pre-mRNA-splicing helicase BRR2
VPKDLEMKKKKAIEGAKPTEKTTVKLKAEAAGFGYADVI